MSFGGEIKKGDRMSPREEEVFRFLGTGLMNKNIAHELGISEVTVKSIVSAVFRKLGVHTRSEAALLAHGIPIEVELARARAFARTQPPLCLPASAAATGIEA